jgi:hypothetical protein
MAARRAELHENHHRSYIRVGVIAAQRIPHSTGRRVSKKSHDASSKGVVNPEDAGAGTTGLTGS